MSSIDERVVEAKFDNKDFQAGVKDTLNSLDNLKKGLKFEGAAQGVEQVGSSFGRVKSHIDAMRIASVVAIATISHQAVIAGERIAKAFTIDPIKAGFNNYEEQINAVQVILANTGLKGKKGMDQVNQSLNTLNDYANKTIYNFSEMARNIGTFTAAGVKLKPATDAIKGIANLAAMSGSSSQQASTAMYQLSQALAAGRVKLQDWNSVVNAGMGGRVFQKALFDTGVAMHTIKSAKVGETFDQWTKSGHTFRNELQNGWLTSKVLTATLQQFTGDMTDAQLKSMGFNAVQIKQIQEQARVANDAATKIKTFHQMTQALREEVASAYAQVFKTLFGDIDQAKALFTPLHNVIQNALTNPILNFNKILQGWAKMGGRFVFLDALKLAAGAVGDVLHTVQSAFREIFPAMTAKRLYDMTVSFHVFAENLKPLPPTLDKIHRIFAGLFAVIDIFWQAIKAAAHFLAELLGTVGHTSRGLLTFAANIGDMLVALDQALKKGQGFTKFFEALRKVIEPIVSLLGLTRIKTLDMANGIATGTKTFISVMQAIPAVFSKIVAKIHETFNNLFAGLDFSKALQLFNAGLFAGLLLLVRKFVNHITRDKSAEGVLNRFVDKITEPFHQLTNTLKEMQRAIQVATLIEIAIAVGILTASVIALSFVDPKKLAPAMAAMTGMFAQLLGSLALFQKVGGAKGLFTTAAGLVVFATALRVLTSSVVALARLSWDQLAKGLAGVSGLLTALVLTTKGMAGNAGGMIRAGIGLTILAEGVKILVQAVTEMSRLSWSSMGKGLAGVAATLLALGLFTRLADANKAGIGQGAGLLLLAEGIKILAEAVDKFGKMHWENIAKGLVSITGILAAFALFSRTVGNPVKMVAAGAALIAVGAAMTILAQAMKSFGGMDWENIAKGLLSMAGALAIIVVAVNSMPVTSVLSAAALVAISVALVTLSGALKIMGSMSWGDIAKGLTVLAGSLLIIASAMEAMVFALPGAAALLVVVAALIPLTAVMKTLGSMSWSDILKALVGLAGALTVLGLAAALLTPLIPSLLGLAGSIALLGVGLAAIGGAVYLFATGLQVLAVAGSGAAAAIHVIFDSIIGLLPMLAKALGQTLTALAEAISSSAPELLKTSIVLVDSLLKAVDREGPKIIRTFFRLMVQFADTLANAIPRLAEDAYRMMMGILNAITKHAGQIVGSFTNMVVNVIHALTKNTSRFVTAAVGWIVAILNGLARNMHRITTAGANVIIAFIQGLGKNAVRIANAAGQAILNFLKGLDQAINTYEPQIVREGGRIAADIAKGLIIGIANSAKDVGNSLFNLGKHALGMFGKAIGRGSPAKEFIKAGQDINAGLIIGLKYGHDDIVNAWTNLRDSLKAAITKSADDVQKYTDKLKTLEAAHKKNPVAIRETTKALMEATHEHKAATAALDTLNKAQAKHYAQLQKLGSQYDALKTKIDAANQSLADAKQLRDDYSKQVSDQYSTLPDIASDTSLTDYETGVKKQIADTQTLADTMAQLRKMGLDDATYKDILSKGTDALPFAQQILSGGQAAVNELKSMDSQLSTEASTLGTNASTALYQAGVNAAQGIVNGLVSQQKAIENQMTKIAQAMVSALKKELKIKSPSEVFAELGDFSGKGLANGLTNSMPHIHRATRILGKNTVESMKESIRQMNDLLASHGDMNPTIKPVLDLSTLRKQATGVGSILSMKKIALDAAYSKALNASEGYEANLEISPGGASSENPTNLSFVQNNYSPKALSSAEIYRQTNNQLSRAKGALTPSATPVP